jgi:uracil-DNA glycosylase
MRGGFKHQKLTHASQATTATPATMATNNLSATWHSLLETYEITVDSTALPPPADIFNALRAGGCADPSTVRVVILGQDPYPTKGNAHGLAFSVRPGVPVPASLRNIYKELAEDLGVPAPTSGNLQAWADQGVLLLNDILTVEEGKPLSHSDRGWQAITDDILTTVLQKAPHVCIVAWGRNAIGKASKFEKLIEERGHTVLRSVHPSPLSAYRGFFGSKPFSKINADLIEHGLEPIRWIA